VGGQDRQRGAALRGGRVGGGKGKVANFVKLLFLRNNLIGYDYVEPDAGGRVPTLLYDEYASRIHVNDLDPSVFAFWYAALHETDDLCHRITSTKVTMEEWELQKVVQRSGTADVMDLAVSAFFLNRTNRSGIIDGGVIGGRIKADAGNSMHATTPKSWFVALGELVSYRGWFLTAPLRSYPHCTKASLRSPTTLAIVPLSTITAPN
jgi:DNA adenine methylase